MNVRNMLAAWSSNWLRTCPQQIPVTEKVANVLVHKSLLHFTFQVDSIEGVVTIALGSGPDSIGVSCTKSRHVHL